MLFVKIRKGPTIKQYLGFNDVESKALLKWLFASCFFIVVVWVLARLGVFGEVEKSSRVINQPEKILPLYVGAFFIAMPAFEEILFRGFLFEGIRSSHLGSMGAIIITSLIWAVPAAYGGMDKAGVAFGMGLMIGFARERTGSILTAMAMRVPFALLKTVGSVIVTAFE
jgi:membrane protease YdiL (CAAX protease family)